MDTILACVFAGGLIIGSVISEAISTISTELILYLYTYKNIFEELENSINDNININIKYLAKRLFSFFSSEKFIPHLISEIKLEEEMPLSGLIYLCENKEKYLSIKLFFNLLEEVINEKFDTQIKEIYNKIKNNPKDLVKIHDLYLENNINNIKEKLEDFLKNIVNKNESKFSEIMNNYTEENKKKTKNLWMLFINIIIFTFPDIIKDIVESEMKK